MARGSGPQQQGSMSCAGWGQQLGAGVSSIYSGPAFVGGGGAACVPGSPDLLWVVLGFGGRGDKPSFTPQPSRRSLCLDLCIKISGRCKNEQL